MYLSSGPTTIRVENIGGTKSAFVQFGTTVYDNPTISSEAASKIAAQRNTAYNPSNSFSK